LKGKPCKQGWKSQQTVQGMSKQMYTQKEHEDNQNSTNEVEDGIVWHKSASDGGALQKENQDNQNRSKEVEDTILCHKSASDGGALAGMS
jgi:hypothetical protein